MLLSDEYRPETFDDVYGQEKAVKTLLKTKARYGFKGLAYWISGASGTGKTTIARIIAKESGAHSSQIIEAQAIDVNPEYMRKMADTIYHGSLFGSRVWIFNESHLLRKNVFGAFLDIIEAMTEKGNDILIFTTTTEGNKALFEENIDTDAIMSRCVKIALTKVGLKEAIVKLVNKIAGKEGFIVPENVMTRITRGTVNIREAVLRLQFELLDLEEVA